MSQPNNGAAGDDAALAGEIGAAGGLTSKSPFDNFDVDFDNIRSRRDRARQKKAEKEAAKAAAAEADAQALMANVDAEASTGDFESSVPSAVRRPTSLATRARTTGSEPAQQSTTITSFFGFANRNQQQNEEGFEDRIREPQYVEIGPRKVAIWPYDDYHLIQKVYYQRLEDKKANAGDDEDEAKAADARETAVPDTSSIPIFQRPTDPPGTSRQ